jgi:hypothetical protein
MKFFAALMIVMGAGMTGLCGLCTLAVAQTPFVPIGLFFVALGLVMLVGGIAMWRGAPRK